MRSCMLITLGLFGLQDEKTNIQILCKCLYRYCSLLLTSPIELHRVTSRRIPKAIFPTGNKLNGGGRGLILLT